MLVFVVKLVVVMMAGPTAETKMPHKPLVNKGNKRRAPVMEVLQGVEGLVLGVGQIQHLLAEGLVLVDGVVMDIVRIKTQLICLMVLGLMVELGGCGRQQEITVVVEGLLLV